MKIKDIEVEDGDLVHLITMWIWARGFDKADVEVNPDGGPVGVRDYLGTERANGEPSVTLDERLSRCNELCTWAITDGSAPASTRLIHGSIHGRYDDNERIAHAWLLIRTPIGEMVWEPATRLWHDKDAWYEWARAWDEREYTVSTVLIKVATSGHYGPWHESRYP